MTTIRRLLKQNFRHGVVVGIAIGLLIGMLLISMLYLNTY